MPRQKDLDFDAAQLQGLLLRMLAKLPQIESSDIAMHVRSGDLIDGLGWPDDSDRLSEALETLVITRFIRKLEWAGDAWLLMFDLEEIRAKMH